MARLQWLCLWLTTHCVLFFIGTPALAKAALVDEDRLQQLAESPAWKKRLHYRAHSLGPERSLMDGADFFLSPNGARDPLAELRATLKTLPNQSLVLGPLKLKPACAFPERLEFLREKLGVFRDLKVDCPKLNNFLTQFKDPESVSVVFSTAFPNNPASMFGHSFLKFSSTQLSDLQNMGINYAARVPEDENPLAFIYFGVFGGYSGQWSLSHYHKKIKEYNQSENRDLWEYELTLSPSEVRRLILHIWELEVNGYFKYYFFDENCSFHVLATIEAIRPQWNITDHLVYMIPGESIKNLTDQQGAVAQVHFRSSVQGRFWTRYNQLDSQAKKNFHQLLAGQEKLSPKAETLDTAIEYFQFMDIKSEGNLPPKERKIQMNLLSQRARLKEPSKPLKVPANQTRPDIGHDAYSAHLSRTHRQRQDDYGVGGSIQLRLRSAYHDLLNDDRGYRPFSHIDFPSLTLQYEERLRKFRLEDLDLLKITSLNPVNFLSWAPSWKFHAGAYTPRESGCVDCLHGFINGGLGWTLPLGSDKQLLFAMLDARFEGATRLQRGFRYGPGLDVGWLLQPFDFMKLMARYQPFWDVDQSVRPARVDRWAVATSLFLERNWEIRWETSYLYLSENYEGHQWESTLGVMHFFR